MVRAKLLSKLAVAMALALLPPGIAAQAAKQAPLIGFAEPGAKGCKPTARTEALYRGLQEAGYSLGRNVKVDRRCYAQDEEMRSALRAFIAAKVDAIVVSAPLPALVARDLSREVPIVCASCGDPLDNGLVQSLSRPGGNVTGFASLSAELIGKRVKLLKDAFPRLTRIAAIINPDNPGTRTTLKALEDSGGALGLAIDRIEFRKLDDLERALRALAGSGAGAILLQDDPYLFASRRQIGAVAQQLGLASSAGNIEFAEEGGLMAYGPDRLDLHRRSGLYVGRILNGARPGDLPFEQPAKFELVLNLRTAKAIGVTPSRAVLLQATRFIE